VLTHEVMGFALLGLSWVTALLVALDAMIDVKVMWSAVRRWKTTLHSGIVDCENFARHQVEQRVKLLDGESPGLIFFDRRHLSLAAGGTVLVDGQAVRVSANPSTEVWVDPSSRPSPPTPDAFASLFAQAQGPGGALRTVETVFTRGQKVWWAADSTQTELIANFDPRIFATSRMALSAAVMVLNVVWVGAGTLCATTAPAFGTVSTVGACLLLAHFLGMTPLAMAAREKSRSPAVAPLRGVWTQPATR
jgi:hypothetical protein